ncbi:hypothetical protein U5O48_003333 [Cronobacter turicensis]|nr:hypothetical protein [Cronobacter turicensis]
MMSLDRWIALGACVAGFISAIAALLVIKQSNLQRKLSYKPQIVFSPQYFEYAFNNELSVSERIKLRSSSNEDEMRSDIAVNIGLGAALNVKISWTHDYERLATISNRYLEKANITDSLEANGDILSYLDSNKKPKSMLVTKHRNETIDYILSYAQKPTPTKVLIPLPFIALTCRAIYYSIQSDNIIDETLPKLMLRVEYQDIGGEKYIDNYHVRIDFHHAAKKKGFIDMGAQLFFDKKRKPHRAAKLTEKVRKSYVDFIREHSYLKNSELD